MQVMLKRKLRKPSESPLPVPSTSSTAYIDADTAASSLLTIINRRQHCFAKINLPHLTVHALLHKLKFYENDNDVYDHLLNDKYILKCKEIVLVN